MVRLIDRSDRKRLGHTSDFFIEKRLQRGALVRELRPQEYEIRTARRYPLVQQLHERPKLAGVIRCPPDQVEVTENDPHVRTRLDIISIEEVHREACHAVTLQAAYQTVKVPEIVVDGNDSGWFEHQPASLKIIATTAPSYSAGTPTSCGCGKASPPSFISIARFE